MDGPRTAAGPGRARAAHRRLVGGAAHGAGNGFGVRTRAALALLVQGLGGSLTISRNYDFTGFGTGFDGNDMLSGDGFGDGGDFPPTRTSTETYTLLPLTVTLLWIVLLVVVLVLMRRRQRGAEAAVRVALTATAGALALALVGQPTIDTDRVGSGPAGVALWSFLLSLAVALIVLCWPALRGWLAVRPGAATVVRAVSTAAVALVVCICVAGAVVLVIAGAHYDQLTGWGVAFAALMVLNLGVAGLGLAWGGPVQGGGNTLTGSGVHNAFGLSDLGDLWGGWSVFGALAGGLLCALLIGFLAVWRSRDRTEQFLVAGAFTLLFAVLAAVGGLAVDGDAGLLDLAGAGRHFELAPSVPGALLYGLLWSFGGVLVAPYLWRALGGRGMPAGAFDRRGEGVAGRCRLRGRHRSPGRRPGTYRRPRPRRRFRRPTGRPSTTWASFSRPG